MRPYTVDEIDQLLPQTQCKLCGYKGCKPYAQALYAKQVPIDRCLPGGVNTLLALATLTGQDATPFIADMQLKAIPSGVAVIQEDACIACTKCIQACPVDAIVGAAQQIHTVIQADCTGCGLCLPPCPVDCIDLVSMPSLTAVQEKAKANKARSQFHRHNTRIKQDKEIKKQLKNQSNTVDYATEIKFAIARVLARKSKS